MIFLARPTPVGQGDRDEEAHRVRHVPVPRGGLGAGGGVAARRADDGAGAEGRRGRARAERAADVPGDVRGRPGVERGAGGGASVAGKEAAADGGGRERGGAGGGGGD